MIESVEEKGPLVIVGDEDADGLMSVRQIAGFLMEEDMRYVERPNSELREGEFSVYIETGNNDLNDQIVDGISKNKPSRLIFLDLRLVDGCLAKVIGLRKSFDFQTLVKDHHEKKFKKEADGHYKDPLEDLDSVVEVSSATPTGGANYGTPTSVLCYRTLATIDEGGTAARAARPWAAVGVIGDRAFKSPFNTALNSEIIKQAEVLFPRETYEYVADALNLVGYSERDKWEVTLDAVMSAKTPLEVIDKSTSASKRFMETYERLDAERTDEINRFRKEYPAKKELNYYPMQLKGESTIAVGLINSLADMYPDENIVVYQIGVLNQEGRTISIFDLRRGDSGINMADLLEYCKRDKDKKTDEKVLKATGGGAVGRIECEVDHHQEINDRIGSYIRLIQPS